MWAVRDVPGLADGIARAPELAEAAEGQVVTLYAAGRGPEDAARFQWRPPAGWGRCRLPGSPRPSVRTASPPTSAATPTPWPPPPRPPTPAERLGQTDPANQAADPPTLLLQHVLDLADGCLPRHHLHPAR
ncbi:Chromate resistance protein ChrB [Streptomyces sp. NPDC005917]|uniref:Chromate resistance protein ChrB n=1 Tax=unclassified Streptomyces TaxID=2593676 RepID=UPI00340549D0